MSIKKTQKLRIGYRVIEVYLEVCKKKGEADSYRIERELTDS